MLNTMLNAYLRAPAAHMGWVARAAARHGARGQCGRAHRQSRDEARQKSCWKFKRAPDARVGGGRGHSTSSRQMRQHGRASWCCHRRRGAAVTGGAAHSAKGSRRKERRERASAHQQAKKLPSSRTLRAPERGAGPSVEAAARGAAARFGASACKVRDESGCAG